MKKKSTSKSAFFNVRVLIAAVFCLIGVFVALLGMGAFSNLFAQTKGTKQPGVDARQDAPRHTDAERRAFDRASCHEHRPARPSLRSGNWRERRAPANAISVSVVRRAGKIGEF